jgi:uncharacterized membrane protein
MNENERIKKAFDFSADLTKQLITLATGIITVTITFSHDFIKNPDAAPKGLAYTAWYFFLASIFFGILTLSALTGNLDAKVKSTEPSIFKANILIFSIPQFITFFTGLVYTILFARRTL